MCYTFDVFILALYLLSHGCALLKYTCKQQKLIMMTLLMMTSDYIVNVARFWKKFVHCDGSYGAGGRQGRYVFSWPAVRMILGFLFVPTRSDYCCALLSLTHSITCVIQTWMMRPWLLKTPTLKIRQWWKKHKKQHSQKYILLHKTCWCGNCCWC